MPKSVNPTDFMSKRDLNEEIAKLAYELYRQRGGNDGYALDDWLKAEKIIMGKYREMAEEESEGFVKHVKKQTAKRNTRKSRSATI